MDPISLASLSALVSSALTSASQEAGAQAWDSLRTLVRRVARRRPELDVSEVDVVATTVDPPMAVAVLHRIAAQDGTFADELSEWMREHRALLVTDSNVNVISGTVHGNVINARDINGSIHL